MAMINMSLIGKLSSIFHDKVPFLILINFILLIVMIYLNKEYIRKLLLKIDRKTWFFLVLIFMMALLIRIFIPPHQHIMYIDEAWYMEAAKNMLQTGSQNYYIRSIGWPFILTIAFGIFGISNWVALYASTVLGALTIFNVFLLTFIITKHKSASLISALLFSFFPAHIRWSASAESIVPSLFFITLTLFFCFLYYTNKTKSLLWLSLISMAFAIQFRPENVVYPVLFLFGCILFDKKFFKKIDIKFVLPFLVLLLLSFANFTQDLDFYLSTDWTEDDSNGELVGDNFGFQNLVLNSSEYGKYLFNNELQPVIFTFLFIIGLLYMFHKQKRESLFLLGWFCLLWFVYFFSYQTAGGGTHYMAKTKFFVSFYPITVSWGVYGILLIKDFLSTKIKSPKVKKLILSLVIVLFAISFIPYSIKASTWFADPAHKLETKIPELVEKDIPHDCVIIANYPTILKSTTDFQVIDVKLFLDNRQNQEKIFSNTDCVLFFEDLTCELWEFEGKQCKKIKDNFLINEFISYEEKDVKYTFYKIFQN